MFVFLAGICRSVGNSVPGDVSEKRDQCRAGFHDHGGGNKE